MIKSRYMKDDGYSLEEILDEYILDLEVFFHDIPSRNLLIHLGFIFYFPGKLHINTFNYFSYGNRSEEEKNTKSLLCKIGDELLEPQIEDIDEMIAFLTRMKVIEIIEVNFYENRTIQEYQGEVYYQCHLTIKVLNHQILKKFIIQVLSLDTLEPYNLIKQCSIALSIFKKKYTFLETQKIRLSKYDFVATDLSHIQILRCLEALSKFKYCSYQCTLESNPNFSTTLENNEYIFNYSQVNLYLSEIKIYFSKKLLRRWLKEIGIEKVVYKDEIILGKSTFLDELTLNDEENNIIVENIIKNSINISSKKFTWDFKKNLFLFGDTKLIIEFGSKQFDLLKTLLSKPSKNWSWDEICEKIKEPELVKNPDNWRIIYSAAKAINHKFSLISEGLPLILHKTKTFSLNSDLLI